MRRIKFFVLAIILLFIAKTATLAENDTDFLYDFLRGSYELVGRWPDSNKTYSGKIVLEKDHGHFRVVRFINGKKITDDPGPAIRFAVFADTMRTHLAEKELLTATAFDLVDWMAAKSYRDICRNGTKLSDICEVN